MSNPTFEEQQKFWDDWVDHSFDFENNPDNARRKLQVLSEAARRQVPGQKILDVGCGSGWLSRELARYGEVAATDLASSVMEENRGRFPGIRWIGGDFLSLELPAGYFHLVTCLETIAHVPDQQAFAAGLARVTRPEGTLLLTSQNEYVWKRTSWLKPPGEGQIRNWPSRKRLRDLFQSYYVIEKIKTCAPGGDRGWPRLFTNRVAARFGKALFGQARWTGLLEVLGFGRSLFMVGRRFPGSFPGDPSEGIKNV
ncbi:MAG: class I SAM-dependent methyltransferase [Deltaproteobacteria bacterium]|nr:class I SAM-dependent methyltransferase [Deltaproteobacteria bacterium]